MHQGLADQLGSTEEDVARGLAVRHDHGIQYRCDRLQELLRFFGIRLGRWR